MVSRRLSNATAPVRSLVRLCGICGVWSCIVACFLRVILNPPTSQYSLIILTSTLYSHDTDSVVKTAKNQGSTNKEHQRTKRCGVWYPDRSAKLSSFHAYGFSRFVCLATVSTAVVGSPVRHVASRWREFNIFTETAVRVYRSCHHKSGLTLRRCVFSLFHCRRRKQHAINGALWWSPSRGHDTLRFRWARSSLPFP